MFKRSLKILVFPWFAVLLSVVHSFGQCAMCRATVETNINEDGVNLADKLNAGILYLFVMPYLLAMIIGYFWFKKSRAHKRELEVAEMRKARIENLS